MGDAVRLRLYTVSDQTRAALQYVCNWPGRNGPGREVPPFWREVQKKTASPVGRAEIPLTTGLIIVMRTTNQRAVARAASWSKAQ
jgi:hypothetical protein